MQFAAPAEHYDRFMGRYAPTLAVALADAAGVDVGAGMRVLDVGCGPGGLTRELAARAARACHRDRSGTALRGCVARAQSGS